MDCSIDAILNLYEPMQQQQEFIYALQDANSDLQKKIAILEIVARDNGIDTATMKYKKDHCNSGIEMMSMMGMVRLYGLLYSIPVTSSFFFCFKKGSRGIYRFNEIFGVQGRRIAGRKGRNRIGMLRTSIEDPINFNNQK